MLTLTFLLVVSVVQFAVLIESRLSSVALRYKTGLRPNRVVLISVIA
jgi:hypothetical protein